MNNDCHDTPDDDTFDDELRDLFGPIRQIDASAELNERCLNIVRESLGSNVALERRPQRELSRQWFLFASTVAASLLIGVTLGWFLRGEISRPGAVVKDSTLPHEAENSSARIAAIPELVNASSHVEYQEGVTDHRFFTSEIYVCGVGRIQSKSEFQISGVSQ